MTDNEDDEDDNGQKNPRSRDEVWTSCKPDCYKKSNAGDQPGIANQVIQIFVMFDLVTTRT